MKAVIIPGYSDNQNKKRWSWIPPNLFKVIHKMQFHDFLKLTKKALGNVPQSSFCVY
jgi:hypothetical protein